MTPNAVELALIDRWQDGFPLVEKPFEVVGRSAALDQDETIGIFRKMRANDIISRVGAVVRPNTVGASTLAAMQVPPELLEQVAGIVSREPLVTHNYEREYTLNLWFVIAGAGPEAIAATIRNIVSRTGFGNPGSSTGGLIRDASGTASVSAATPPPVGAPPNGLPGI